MARHDWAEINFFIVQMDTVLLVLITLIWYKQSEMPMGVWAAIPTAHWRTLWISQILDWFVKRARSILLNLLWDTTTLNPTQKMQRTPFWPFLMICRSRVVACAIFIYYSITFSENKCKKASPNTSTCQRAGSPGQPACISGWVCKGERFHQSHAKQSGHLANLRVDQGRSQVR